MPNRHKGSQNYDYDSTIVWKKILDSNNFVPNGKPIPIFIHSYAGNKEIIPMTKEGLKKIDRFLSIYLLTLYHCQAYNKLFDSEWIIDKLSNTKTSKLIIKCFWWHIHCLSLLIRHFLGKSLKVYLLKLFVASSFFTTSSFSKPWLFFNQFLLLSHFQGISIK